jgi:AcrR family transcriptional regulator
MTTVASRDGYATTTVAQVITHAGVSRPTFYDYFADKQDCFIAALAEIQERLLAQVRRSLDQSEPSHAAHTAIRALIEFADAEPALARLLIEQATVCGSRGLDARDEGIEEIARIIEIAQGQAPASAAIPDFPGYLLIGGIYRLLAPRLRRGEHLAGLLGDLQSWISSYNRPHSEHRWREPRAPEVPVSVPVNPETPLRAPIALPPGRPRVSEEEVSENHRQRILFAAAEAVADKGHAAATVSEIAKRAGLDSRAFYRQFRDKQEVFAAAHELYFRHVIATTASAFFRGENWAERTWEAGLAFSQSIERSQSLGYLSFIEFYAAGPAAIERHTDLMLAFTVFLQEGYQHKTPSESPTPLALEAIAATNFEIIYRQIRNRFATQLFTLLPFAAYLSLAPFLGTEATNEFIDEKLAEFSEVTPTAP